jgi:hypothetical protein
MNSASDGSAEQQEQGRRRERDLGEYIREEPLTSLAIAGAAGFILGGGANSRIGLACLAMVGKIALRGAATNFIVGLIFPDPNRTTPEHANSSRRHRDERHDNARHDDGRTDF